MLVLSRKRGERVRIEAGGEVIWLEVTDFSKGQVRRRRQEAQT